QPPEQRGDFFTAKCVTAAQRLRVALIRTPDLFAPARYLSANEDAAFAQSCRQAIFATEGSVVVFPPMPSGSAPEATDSPSAATPRPEQPPSDEGGGMS